LANIRRFDQSRKYDAIKCYNCTAILGKGKKGKEKEKNYKPTNKPAHQQTNPPTNQQP
jgi:hypothetical protein